MRTAAICFVALAAAFLLGCAALGGDAYAPQPTFTAQPVEKIALLNPGMSKQEVAQVMGLPVRTEFSSTKEAWHFCRTGSGADEFAVVLFSDGKVSAARNYNVTLADTGGATGDCSKFVRSVFR